MKLNGQHPWHVLIVTLNTRVAPYGTRQHFIREGSVNADRFLYLVCSRLKVVARVVLWLYYKVSLAQPKSVNSAVNKYCGLVE